MSITIIQNFKKVILAVALALTVVSSSGVVADELGIAAVNTVHAEECSGGNGGGC